MHVVLQCVRLVLCMCVQASREGKYCTVVTATLLIQIVTRFGTKIVIIISDHVPEQTSSPSRASCLDSKTIIHHRVDLDRPCCCRHSEDRLPSYTSSKSRQGAECASTRCHVSYIFRLHLPVEVDLGAAMCPTVPDLTSLLR
jgi:hypothetical protein